MDDRVQELAGQVDTAQWEWLRAHNERGALIVVDGMLELAQVGDRIAADDMASVQAWLASGLLAKPTREQLDRWDAEPHAPFAMLVISPYVLIQQVE